MKKIIYIIFFFVISLLIFFSVLIYGVSTSSFNVLIQNQFENNFKKLKLEFNDVKINYDIKNFVLKFSILEPKLYHGKNLTNINQANFGFGLFSVLKKDYNPTFIEVGFKENSIENTVFLIKDVFIQDKKYFFDEKIKKGTIEGKLQIFNDDRLSVNFNGFVKDATFRLSKDTPEFEQVTAKIDIKKNDYVIEFLSGKIFGLNVDKSKINIKNIDNIYKTDLSLLLTGKFNSLSELRLLKIKAIEDFTKNFDQFSLDVSSSNILQLDINKDGNILKQSGKGKADISNLNFKISKNTNQELFDEKNSLFQNGKFKLDYTLDNVEGSGIIFNQKNSYDFKFNTNLKNNTSKINLISELNYSNYPKIFDSNYFKGSSKVFLQINLNNNDLLFEGKADLKKSYINLNFINSSKLLDDDGQLFFKGIFKKNTYDFDKIELNSKSTKVIVTNIVFDKDFSLLQLENAVVKSDNNNFTITSSLKSGMNTIDVNGKLLDAKFIINSVTSSKSSSFFSKKFNGNLKVNIEKVKTGTEDDLFNLKFNSTITKGIFTKLDMDGSFSKDEKITAKIERGKNGNLNTKVLSDRARPFAATFSFIKGFEKGKLDFYSEDLSLTSSKGKIVITDFTVKEIPVLAKLLTIASVTGVLDTLRGKGVRFDNMVINFENDEKFFTFKEFYGTGSALGFIIDGKINNQDTFVSLSGNLIPAYEINKLISNIPLIGQILTGKAGDGIYGVSFKIKGKDPDYDIEINPIKTLTPRFVQRFFEIFKTKN